MAFRGSAQFPTTLWSLVISAVSDRPERSREALEQLCSAYWYPVYCFIRRKGYEAEASRDLTQEFFARLVEKRYISAADRSLGRFRTFLLTAVQRFLLNEFDSRVALKRGGGVVIEALDGRDAERRYSREPSHQTTPEAIYERRWALTVLDRALERLKAAAPAHFEQLTPFLTGDAERGAYEQVAPRLGMSEGALKVAVHRLRRQYQESLRAEIAQTVGSESEIEGEIKYLLEILSRTQQDL